MHKIYDRLTEYSDTDYYGFHMPGHKRNLNMLGSAAPYAIDITEIEGFDDLHHAAGILEDAQRRAAQVYRADETHFLVNGSTVGILSAIAGVTHKGDTILVARNCHKSVYHAIDMNELNPVYLMPAFDSDAQLNTEVSVDDVKSALEKNPKIRAVVIVSPTYDGVVSDVEAIAEAVHEKGIPIIVDEAHGAHFGFHPYFPENANVKGADIVIHSLHKTLPSLTQTALLHMNGRIVRRERVRKYLHMLQSSSPSYILIASIDSCVDMLDNKREELFEPYVEMLERTRERLKGLRYLRVIRTEHFDRSKIVISVKETNMPSRQLYRLLLEAYHLQMEMVAGSYVLAMTSVGDTEEGMERLAGALEEIDLRIGKMMLEEKQLNCLSHKENAGPEVGYQIMQSKAQIDMCMPEPEVVYNIADVLRLSDNISTNPSQQVSNSMTDEAVHGMAGTLECGLTAGDIKRVPWKDSVGYVAMEYAYLYPPGCPLIVPGERVSQKAADMLQWYCDQQFTIEGLKKEGYIEVWVHG